MSDCGVNNSIHSFKKQHFVTACASKLHALASVMQLQNHHKLTVMAKAIQVKFYLRIICVLAEKQGAKVSQLCKCYSIPLFYGKII